MTANETASDAVHTAETLYNDVIRLVAADPEDKRLLETQIHGARHFVSLSRGRGVLIKRNRVSTRSQTYYLRTLTRTFESRRLA